MSSREHDVGSGRNKTAEKEALAMASSGDAMVNGEGQFRGLSSYVAGGERWKDLLEALERQSYSRVELGRGKLNSFYSCEAHNGSRLE